MDKFIYAIGTDSDVEIKSIMATSIADAENRIIDKFWNKYKDVTSEEWDDFLSELYDKYGILISSKILEIDEL